MHIRPPLARLACILVVVLVSGACSGGTQPLALVASSPGSLEVGSQRVLLGLVEPETQEFLAAPDLEAKATFTGPSEETISDVPLEFVWAVPDVRGLYRAEIEFPAAGAWSVIIDAEGYPATEATVMVVGEDTAMPQVGDAAPSVATRTSGSHPLSEITSDPDPDPDLYELSLDAALADDRPTVVVFATPAFCTSATCGPVLDNVKTVADSHPEADFLHVEVYENLDADSFEDLITVEAVDIWALPSEPWVFVTDADGTVTARFEGTIDPVELENALADLAP